jgi:hypothetical protein
MFTMEYIYLTVRNKKKLEGKNSMKVLGKFHFVLIIIFASVNFCGWCFAEKYHPTSREVEYKCLFNHDGMIAYTFLKDKDPKVTGPAYIGSFIEKLKDTDVDLVLVSPNAGRSLAYPSKVNPMWKKYMDGHEEKRRRGHG